MSYHQSHSFRKRRIKKEPLRELITEEQKEMLIDLLEELHSATLQSYEDGETWTPVFTISTAQWTEMAAQLNPLGLEKTADEWESCWNNIQTQFKAKYCQPNNADIPVSRFGCKLLAMISAEKNDSMNSDESDEDDQPLKSDPKAKAKQLSGYPRRNDPITAQQKAFLIKHMEGMFSGANSQTDKEIRNQAWLNLTDEMNKRGTPRSLLEWTNCWSCLKSKTKRKYKRHKRNNGARPALSATDRQILAIIKREQYGGFDTDEKLTRMPRLWSKRTRGEKTLKSAADNSAEPADHPLTEDHTPWDAAPEAVKVAPSESDVVQIKTTKSDIKPALAASASAASASAASASAVKQPPPPAAPTVPKPFSKRRLETMQKKLLSTLRPSTFERMQNKLLNEQVEVLQSMHKQTDAYHKDVMALKRVERQREEAFRQAIMEDELELKELKRLKLELLMDDADSSDDGEEQTENGSI